MSRNIHQRHVAALAVVLASVFAAVAPGETPTARHTVEITGDWRFQMDVPDIGEKENWPVNSFRRSRWAKVDVPKAWDLFDESMWGYEGIGWYSTEIAGSLAVKGKVQRLKFGRVNYQPWPWRPRARSRKSRPTRKN